MSAVVPTGGIGSIEPNLKLRPSIKAPGQPAALNPEQMTQQALSELETAQQALEAKNKGLEASYQSQAAPLRQGLTAAQQDRSALPQPTFQAPVNQAQYVDQKTMDDQAGWMMLVAGLMGAMSRAPLTASLNALAAMKQGMRDGNQEQYERGFKEYQQKYKEATDAYKREADDYERIWNDKTRTIAEKEADLRLLASEHNNEILRSNQRFDLVAKHVDAVIRTAGMMQSKTEALNARMFEAQQRHLDRQAAIQAANARASEAVRAKTPLTLIADMVDRKELTPEEGQKMRAMILANPALMFGGRGGTGGALVASRMFNVMESAGQVVKDLHNVNQIASGTVLGTFAGMTGKSGESITEALRNTFTRNITDADTRAMQQFIAALDQNMSRALGGGYAMSSAKHLLEAYQQQVAKEGDSPWAQAVFLARMKQELGVLFRNAKAHPGYNQEYDNIVKEYKTELDKSIPFNVDDVLTAMREDRKTIGQDMNDLLKISPNNPLPAESASRQSAPEGATTKSGATVSNW